MITNATISARFLPRNGPDLALSVLLAISVGALFFAVPALLAYLVSHDIAVSAVIAACFFLVLFLLVAMPAFRSVSIDSTGLTFRRYVGPSIHVPWNAITEFRSIPAGEVFPRVWLRVGFPPRGSILSLSSLDHFYIEWR